MRQLQKWILVIMLITLAARVSAFTIPYEQWMGAYVGDKKVGYLSYKIDNAEFDGVKGYKIYSVLNNRLTILGADLNQLVTTVVYTDSNYAPLKEDFSMSSGGKTTKISAKFEKKTIECVISAGSGMSKQSVPIPEKASLVSDSLFSMTDPNPTVGKEYSQYYFNPLTLTVDALKVVVERKEKITLDGKEYDAIVLRNTTAMGDMTVWQEPSGDVLKVVAMMGISMRRQSKDEAIKDVGAGSSDFAVLTSIKTDREIPAPRLVKSLDIVLKGLRDSNMIISDSRQEVIKGDEKPGSVHFKIKAAKFDSSKSLNLPVSKPAMDEYLMSTPYLDHDMKSVKDKALSIVGDEKSAYTACSKIRSWVYGNLKYNGSIGITRCASDVLKSKEGVCRDYAILFAALTRSQGIPAKVVSGVLYANGGFYYHAWVECYVGEWVPFDGTLTTDFVDATHIKMAEGDATSMFGLAKIMGSLKAEVKAFK